MNIETVPTEKKKLIEFIFYFFINSYHNNNKSRRNRVEVDGLGQDRTLVRAPLFPLQVVSLLKKWPEMKSKLHVCLNQPLADPIRQLAWKLFLSNPKGTYE